MRHRGFSLRPLRQAFSFLDAPTAPARLLVVDDEDGVRAYVARVLSGAGFVVETASSGTDALDTISNGQRFDLIVADVRMPQMTGPEMIAQLRAREAETKVLYLTGYADQLFRERETLWEDEAFLDKPCSSKGLIEAVQLLLNGHIDAPGSSGELQSCAARNTCRSQERKPPA